ESFDYRGVPFAAWLFRIAHDRVVDYFRRQAGKETVSLGERLRAPGEGPAAITEAALARERLRQAFGWLTEEQQQVIVFKFGEGLTNAEVGRLLGKSEGAVKSLQHRALASLRRFLDKEG
ncbi:MAG: sigma-70 family RNA polymerase sigma factor, partial [Anaerolineae bacterium]